MWVFFFSVGCCLVSLFREGSEELAWRKRISFSLLSSLCVSLPSALLLLRCSSFRLLLVLLLFSPVYADLFESFLYKKRQRNLLLLHLHQVSSFLLSPYTSDLRLSLSVFIYLPIYFSVICLSSLCLYLSICMYVSVDYLIYVYGSAKASPRSLLDLVLSLSSFFSLLSYLLPFFLFSSRSLLLFFLFFSFPSCLFSSVSFLFVSLHLLGFT